MKQTNHISTAIDYAIKFHRSRWNHLLYGLVVNATTAVPSKVKRLMGDGWWVFEHSYNKLFEQFVSGDPACRWLSDAGFSAEEIAHYRFTLPSKYMSLWADFLEANRGKFLSEFMPYR